MKLSTLVLATAAALVSTTASADVRKPCDFNDYQALVHLLNGGATIKAGAEMKGAILGMLAEEMGPKCEKVIPTDIMTIPGDHFYSFEISSGERLFKIGVAEHGVETGNYTSISLSQRQN